MEFLSSESELLHLGSVCVSVGQKNVKKCQNMSKSVKTCHIRQVGLSICQSVCLSVKKMSKTVKKCQNMSKSVKTCHIRQVGLSICQSVCLSVKNVSKHVIKVSKLVKTCQKSVKSCQQRCSIFCQKFLRGVLAHGPNPTILGAYN